MNSNMEYAVSPYVSKKFMDILTKYHAERITRERTMQQYIYVFNAICDHTKCDFLDLRAEQIQDFFFHNKETNAVSSTDYNLSVMRAVSRYMDQNAVEFHIEPRYLSLFATVDVIFPDLAFDPNALPDLESVDKVLSHFRENGDMVGFLSCALVLRCSLTTNEMVKLQRSMLIQDSNGNYGIRMQLTNHASRYVKIPDDIVELVRQYAKQRNDSLPAFFLNKKGKPISARALQNRLSEACLASGVKPFTYNDLRTLSQTIMIRDGAPLNKIAQHANLKQTDWFFRYNRVVEELKDSAVDYAHIKMVW